MKKGKANIVMDGQWGSTGKGKLVGYLALTNEVNAAVCDFMSNAGHTWVSDRGDELVTCQLPMAFVNMDCMLLINPGAAITVDRLKKELEMFQDYKVADRLMIHPHAAIITEEDRKQEAIDVTRISSTLKGCGGSLSRKVMRIASLAKDCKELERYIGDTTSVTHSMLRSGGTVLLEGAQGFDLSLNHGTAYPFTTSRDITTMSILNNAGVPPFYLGDCYGAIRTYPIRVGNTYDAEGNETGHSGPHYPDQEEVSWDYVKEKSGAEISQVERTTVTQKVRRVFTFSYQQIDRYINICAPSKLFVNFINHIDANDVGVRTLAELSPKSKAFLEKLNKHLIDKYADVRCVPIPVVSHVGTGKHHSDMVELGV